MNSNTSPLRDESQLSDEQIFKLWMSLKGEPSTWHRRNAFARLVEAEVRSLRSQEPIAWYCDACGNQGGRKVWWQKEKPSFRFNAFTFDGPAADWFPLYASPPSQPIASDVVAAPDAAPDMLKICAALGFDPTNHHNAAKCPYCRPDVLSRQSPVEADTQTVCLACKGSATTRCETTDRGEDDYEYDKQCAACGGTGSADIRDAIEVLGRREIVTVGARTETFVSLSQLLQIIDARAAAASPSDTSQGVSEAVQSLTRAGARMSNWFYNTAQRPGTVIDAETCKWMKRMQTDWDEARAALRSEPT